VHAQLMLRAAPWAYGDLATTPSLKPGGATCTASISSPVPPGFNFFGSVIARGGGATDYENVGTWWQMGNPGAQYGILGYDLFVPSNAFWLRCTVISGTIDGYSATGSWLNAASDYEWLKFSGTGTAVLRIELAVDAAGTTIIGTGDFTIIAT